jgi:hypothetical protein
MTDLEMKGKVSAIDMQKRTLTMKDEQGVLHIYQWTEVLIKSAMYWQEGRDIWPKEKGTFKPRNERLIVIQSCAKLAADVLLAPGITHLSYTRPQGVMGVTINEGGIDFNEAMDIIITRAIKDTETIMKAGGEGK